MGNADRVRLLALAAMGFWACAEALSPSGPLEEQPGEARAERSLIDIWSRAGPLPKETRLPAPIEGFMPLPITFPRPCAEIYDEDRLPTFEVEISDSDWRSLEAEFAAREYKGGDPTYFPITFKYGNEVISDARMKLRGNNSDCNGKMQFAISFNQVNRNGRFQGMRRINLDHGGCHIFEERLAMSFARDLGLPYSCVNHARLVVNGKFYGLFNNLEHQNKDFLKRHFADHDGNLYKRDKELRTNEDEANTSDIEAYRHATGLQVVENLVDIEAALDMWAFEVVVMAWDNYWWKGYNYMLYSHPVRGFVFVPNDLDQTSPSSPSMSELDEIWPSTLQFPANIVLSDAKWRTRFEERLQHTARAYDSDEFVRRIDRWWAQIRQAAEQDPFISHEAQRRWERVREGVRTRGEHLKGWR